MKEITKYRDLKYYILMYRRAVSLLYFMALLCLSLVFFLLYAYAAQDSRKFYASAAMYKVTEIYPSEY